MTTATPWSAPATVGVKLLADGPIDCCICGDPLRLGETVSDSFVYKLGELAYIELAHGECVKADPGYAQRIVHESDECRRASSLRGFVRTSYKALRAVLGDPSADPMEKTSTEWSCRLGDVCFSVYDYKAHARRDDSLHRWHIGGVGFGQPDGSGPEPELVAELCRSRGFEAEVVG